MSRSQRRECLAAFLFLLPNVLGFLVFTSFPVLASLLLAFTDWNLLEPPRFVGLTHFATLFTEPNFWRYAWNTLVLMLGIPVSIAGSLILALVMRRHLPGVGVFRTLYFLPTVSSGVALFILWKWIYNPEFGLLNRALLGLSEGLGFPLPPSALPGWLTDPAWAKPALILMGIWISVGGPNMVLYLAGLANIPPELEEAAKIDGAGRWAVFRHITWPMLAPTTFFIVVMSVIGGLQGSFEQVYIMTGGGPAGATTTLSFYIYDRGFEWFQMGYASAVAWTLFVVVFLVTLVQWRYGRGAETFIA